MAAEAEAAREARAKVIAAEGEMRASRALKEASDVISESPAALQVSGFSISIILCLCSWRLLNQSLYSYKEIGALLSKTSSSLRVSL